MAPKAQVVRRRPTLESDVDRGVGLRPDYLSLHASDYAGSTGGRNAVSGLWLPNPVIFDTLAGNFVYSFSRKMLPPSAFLGSHEVPGRIGNSSQNRKPFNGSKGFAQTV
ncbi:hypothetical protein DFH06DRAFT_1141848 [Mycena polygramma]|nr:hypothetical protein DFH06DRAFT_1141848 [Mycena polygramma]